MMKLFSLAMKLVSTKKFRADMCKTGHYAIIFLSGHSILPFTNYNITIFKLGRLKPKSMKQSRAMHSKVWGSVCFLDMLNPLF